MRVENLENALGELELECEERDLVVLVRFHRLLAVRFGVLLPMQDLGCYHPGQV